MTKTSGPASPKLLPVKLEPRDHSQAVWNYVTTLFASKPLPYILLDKHSPSNKTRPPKHFDLHLAPELQVTRVVFSEDLPRKISALCDERLAKLLEDNQRQACANPIPPDLCAPLAAALVQSADILAEEGLVRDYPRRTAKPCLIIASTLAFGFDINWQTIFKWDSQEANHGDTGLCDGYLSIDKAHIQHLSDSQRQDIELLQSHGLKCLVPFEMKSLKAGNLSTMQGIVKVAQRGEFSWTTCPTDYPAGKTPKCGAISKHSRKHVTGRRTGPDSEGIWEPDQSKLGSESSSSTWPDIEERYLTKARYIIQQVVAEMVKEDATLAVISSGNIEILVRRNRTTQTLYISDVIFPDVTENPAHYKLHTSLYYVAYIDALNRARQMDLLPSQAPRPAWAANYDKLYDTDSNLVDEVSPSDLTDISGDAVPLIEAESTHRGKEPEKHNMVGIKELFDQLAKADAIFIRLPLLRFGSDNYKLYIRKGARPLNFLADNPENLSSGAPVRLLNYGGDMPTEDYNISQVRFHIDTEPAPMEGGSKAYRASVTQFDSQNNPTLFSDNLVVKLAMCSTDKFNLQKDYDGHCRNPALTAYGLFTSADKKKAYDVLLLQNGGISLDKLLSRGPMEKTKTDYLDAISNGTMEELHAHGIQHNHADASHVVCQPGEDNKRKFNLISYGDSTDISPPSSEETASERKSKRAKIMEADTEYLRLVLDPEA